MVINYALRAALMRLESSITLYSTGVTLDNHHMTVVICLQYKSLTYMSIIYGPTYPAILIARLVKLIIELAVGVNVIVTDS
jgi:hypothetical protein